MSLIAINTIKKKIADTKSAIDEARTIENIDIKEFSLHELNRRLANLELEYRNIMDAQQRERITIRMFGEKIASGKIMLRALASVLDSFQKLADSIAMATICVPNEMGRVPDKIKSITDFNVVSTAPGSFSVCLEKYYDQLNLHSTELDQTMKGLFDIIDQSQNYEKLFSLISHLGKRTITSYREWLHQLNNNEINLELTWVDTSASKRVSRLRSELTKTTIEMLEQIETVEESELIFSGTLTGINTRSLTFELYSDDGIIKGKSSFATLVNISDKLSQPIKAVLTKSTSQTKTGLEQISWYLTKVLDTANSQA